MKPCRILSTNWTKARDPCGQNSRYAAALGRVTALKKQIEMAEKAATLVENWAEEDLNGLDEEKNDAQGSPMAIVPEELAYMKSNYEKALIRIAQLENFLRNSLTPLNSGYDISKVAGAPQAALPPRALIYHSDREEPLPNKQRTYAEVAQIPAGAQAHVKKVQNKYASCIIKQTHSEHRGPPGG